MLSDSELGLTRKISRRDLLQSTATIAGAAALGGATPTLCHTLDRPEQPNYPPALTGLRGSHVGSYEQAHALAAGHLDLDSVELGDSYDLVIVGAGISGLSAAYFYRKNHPGAKILILDNHDDFGGHAKRNEFDVNGRSVIGYGGSQSLESPGDYSETSRQLLAELSVDLESFYEDFDQDFFVREGLSSGVFFDAKTYGRDTYIHAPFLLSASLLGFAPSVEPPKEAIQRMPLSATARTQLLSLVDQSEDKLPNVDLFDVAEYLNKTTYANFLESDVGITSDELQTLLRRLTTGYFGVGTDAAPALESMLFGLPGLNKTGIFGAKTLARLAAKLVEPYIFHFPDGNASIARLLVRSLVPELTQTTLPKELLHTRFDYSLLDRPENNVRIRLNSTAVNVTNTRDGTEVYYRTHNKTIKVRAQKTILACYNAMVPYLCPTLPQHQKEALSEAVKVPLVYTNVALNNWRSLKSQGMGFAYTPSAFHSYCMVDFPVSMGQHKYANNPDDPMVLHFSEALIEPGLHPKAQHRAGRARLLATPFDDIERDVRSTLAGILAPGGFDPAADIAAITVNRWPHGYTYTPSPLFDPAYAEGEAPHEIGRQTFKNIAIANSDAGARAYLDEAIDQAYRAVSEVS